MWLPRRWPIIPCALLAALAAALAPGQATRIGSSALAVAVLVATYHWNRIVTLRRVARRSAETSGG